MLLLMVIARLSLRMVKRGQERRIRWLEKMKSMQDKCTNPIREKVSFQELFSSYGEKYNPKIANFLSRLHIQKFIINKSKIF